MGKLNPRFFATQIEEISKIEKILFISLIFQICVAKISPEASGFRIGIYLIRSFVAISFQRTLYISTTPLSRGAGGVFL